MPGSIRRHGEHAPVGAERRGTGRAGRGGRSDGRDGRVRRAARSSASDRPTRATVASSPTGAADPEDVGLYALRMAPYSIRVVGDPVLRQRAAEVTEIDGRLAKLAEDMIATMYDAPGVGLAAPQVGVEKRMFVYDVGDGPAHASSTRRSSSPTASGRTRRAACRCPASPGRSSGPSRSTSPGVDLDGNEVAIEADELLARCFQHELDHLDGVLLLERLEPTTRKQALKAIRELGIRPSVRPTPSPRAAASRFGSVTAGRPGAAAHPRRLVFLGTPEAAVPPAAGAGRRRLRRRPGRVPPDKRRGRGGRTIALAGEARGARPRPAGDRPTSTTCSTPAPTSGWWWRSAASSSRRAGAPADGQPALLAAAPVAGRGAGRAGDPGRRRADGRLPHGARGGPRHRRRVRPGRGARSAPTRPPTSCASGCAALGTELLLANLRDGLAEPRPQQGEPTYADKIDPAELQIDWRGRRSTSTGWSGSAGPGPRTGATGSRCGGQRWSLRGRAMLPCPLATARYSWSRYSPRAVGGCPGGPGRTASTGGRATGSAPERPRTAG